MAAADDYHPGFSDAALASAALPPDFTQNFTQSLLSDYHELITSGDFTSYTLSPPHQSPSPTTTNDTPESTMGPSEIAYPLSLFDRFPEVPSAECLDLLTRAFHDKFLAKAPFLSSVSGDDGPGIYRQLGIPPYLAFSKALLGVTFSKRREAQRWTSNLYISSVKTFVGAVELDNRTSRSHNWFVAGILLVAFGMLQSNSTIWHTVTMLNGYCLIPYTRSGLFQLRAPQPVPMLKELALLTSFYFLVDLLRAIHMNTPPSINPSDLSLPLDGPGNMDFETLYQRIIYLRQPLEANLDPDTYFLALLCILSETVLLLRFLGPIANQGTDLTLPSSASREYLQQAESLEMSLAIWHRSVHSPGLPTPTDQLTSMDARNPEAPPCAVTKETLALAHFCHILLEVGPRVLTLPQRVGYPRSASSQFDNRAALNDPSLCNDVRVSDAAMECAWAILDLCDSHQDPMPDDDASEEAPQETPPMAIWLPLVVFYAGIVVWCRMREDQRMGIPTGAYNSLSARRRIMKDFQTALRTIGGGFECAVHMAKVLRDLPL